jgi:hypothetical protein
MTLHHQKRKSPMEALLARIAANDDADVSLLVELISDIRPDNCDNVEQAGNNVLALCYLLEQSPVIACWVA